MFKEDLEKSNYSIGETAKILEIEQHVVRFWSNTFSDYIKPIRKAGERRYYTKKDIETLFKIKDMVYNQKYSLGGVKIILQNTIKKEQVVHSGNNELNKLQSQLVTLKKTIEHFLSEK